MNCNPIVPVCVLIAVLLSPVQLFAQWGERNNQRGNEQFRRQQAEQMKRREESKKDFDEKKAKEGLREWSLTGTLRGTGKTIQFIPDRGTGDVNKEIGAIMIGGKVRADVEALVGQPLDKLNGKKVQLDFYGEPKRSGSRLSFNAMSGDIKEWRGMSVLEGAEAANPIAEPKATLKH